MYSSSRPRLSFFWNTNYIIHPILKLSCVEWHNVYSNTSKCQRIYNVTKTCNATSAQYSSFVKPWLPLLYISYLTKAVFPFVIQTQSQGHIFGWLGFQELTLALSTEPLSQTEFLKHRPSGPMLSTSQNVRLSVHLSVCPSVCLFTFEVPCKRIFATSSQSLMSNIWIKVPKSVKKSSKVPKRWVLLTVFSKYIHNSVWKDTSELSPPPLRLQQ